MRCLVLFLGCFLAATFEPPIVGADTIPHPKTYVPTLAEVEKYKGFYDDPRPILKTFGPEQVLPPELYMRLSYDVEKMKTLYIPVGPAGCGKSTFLKKNLNGCHVVSPDAIRFKMLDYPKSGIDFDRKIEPEVWETAYKQLDEALNEGSDIFFDATNLNFNRRYPVVARGLKYNYRIVMIFFRLDLWEIIRRNSSRRRRVPDSVLAKQWLSMYEPEEFEYDELRIVE